MADSSRRREFVRQRFDIPKTEKECLFLIFLEASYFQQQEASCHGDDRLQSHHVRSSQPSSSPRLWKFPTRGKWNEVKVVEFLQKATIRYILFYCKYLKSCAPSWKRPEDMGYNLYLFGLGFFLPVIIIVASSVLTLSTIYMVSLFACFVFNKKGLQSIVLTKG